jgi:3-oxoacyl-[acyl-carrier protein] reductase
MSAPLANKVAIVTGGSKGIGAATVVELVSLGAKVRISSLRALVPSCSNIDSIN